MVIGHRLENFRWEREHMKLPLVVGKTRRLYQATMCVCAEEESESIKEHKTIFLLTEKHWTEKVLVNREYIQFGIKVS